MNASAVKYSTMVSAFTRQPCVSTAVGIVEQHCVAQSADTTARLSSSSMGPSVTIEANSAVRTSDKCVFGMRSTIISLARWLNSRNVASGTLIFLLQARISNLLLKMVFTDEDAVAEATSSKPQHKLLDLSNRKHRINLCYLISGGQPQRLIQSSGGEPQRDNIRNKT